MSGICQGRMQVALAVCIAGVLTSVQCLNATTYLSEDEALALAFPEADHVEFKRALATREQRAQLQERLRRASTSRFFKYYIGRRDGRVTGYAVIGNVIGKHQPITYLIGFTPNQEISLIEIMAYRESYGYEIRSERFLKQFHGTDVDDSLVLNKDIRNIAGATLSCRALIRASRENLAMLSVLVPREETPTFLGKEAAVGDSAKPVEYSQSSQSQMRSRSRLLMGTTLDITAYGNGTAFLDRAINAAFEEVSRIESLISTFIPNSELSLLNSRGAKEIVTLSPEVYELLVRCRDITLESEGVFDVTASPLIQLWSRAESSQRRPSSDALIDARRNVGIRHVQFLGDHQIRFTRDGISINLGAIGKGYAMDRAAMSLKNHGIRRALLNFGGQLLAMNPPPGRTGWTVWIRHPSEEMATLGRVLLANQALATSADYERGIVIDGQVYSHIIDARSGNPANALACATVLASTGEEADAWSTALFGHHQSRISNFANPNRREILVVDKKGEIHSTADAFLIEN